jgi:hypothetical protein
MNHRVFSEENMKLSESLRTYERKAYSADVEYGNLSISAG